MRLTKEGAIPSISTSKREETLELTTYPIYLINQSFALPLLQHLHYLSTNMFQFADPEVIYNEKSKTLGFIGVF